MPLEFLTREVGRQKGEMLLGQAWPRVENRLMVSAVARGADFFEQSFPGSRIKDSDRTEFARSIARIRKCGWCGCCAFDLLQQDKAKLLFFDWSFEHVVVVRAFEQ